MLLCLDAPYRASQGIPKLCSAYLPRLTCLRYIAIASDTHSLIDIHSLRYTLARLHRGPVHRKSSYALHKSPIYTLAYVIMGPCAQTRPTQIHSHTDMHSSYQAYVCQGGPNSVLSMQADGIRSNSIRSLRRRIQPVHTHE